VEKRVNRIEDQVAKTFSEITNLNKRVGKMNNRMTKMEQAAIQIKYTAFGALGVFVLTQVGLLEFLKLVK
jgi:hypothetical protein